MKRKMCLWGGLLLGLACWGVTADGATLSGRLTTSGYAWRTEEADGTSLRHLRLYQSVIANARRLGGKPVSFHVFGQVSGDVLDEVSGRQRYRVYHAYLHWRAGGALGLGVSAGRQRIFSGVGYGTMDGIRVQASPRPEIRLSGYAGILVPVVSDDEIGTWDEGHLWGGQALFEVKQTTLGVSFAERSRAPMLYAGPGQFTEVTHHGARQVRRLGVDLRQGIGGKAEVYGRLDLDAEEIGLHEAEVSAEVRATPDLRISAEFVHREPDLSLNSILSVFEVSSNQEVGGRVYYRLNPQAGISASAARVIYDGDSTWRVGLGVTLGNAYVGYSRRIGYGGQNDAFSAMAQHALTPRLTLKADGSISGYRVYEDQAARDRALAASLGATYRPQRKLSFSLEGQVLRNAYYARDFRLFFRASMWFFKRGQ